MKLGSVPEESAIQGIDGGGFINNALRWMASVISTGFNLEHDTETSRHSTIKALGTIAERGRTVPMGDWINVPWGAVAFAGDAAAWTLQAADVIALKYTLIGHTLLYNFYLDATSVTAGNNYLILPLPPGFKAATSAEVPFEYSDNGTLGVGIAQVLAATTLGTGLSVRLYTATVANWAASANLTRVAGQVMIEIA